MFINYSGSVETRICTLLPFQALHFVTETSKEIKITSCIRETSVAGSQYRSLVSHIKFETRMILLCSFLHFCRVHKYRNQQVAQGQYVVSDTRCPALSDCESEGGEAGQRPRRGRSPVEHRGTFVRPA